MNNLSYRKEKIKKNNKNIVKIETKVCEPDLRILKYLFIKSMSTFVTSENFIKLIKIRTN